MFMVTYMFQKEYSKTAAASDPFIFKNRWYETRNAPPQGGPQTRKFAWPPVVSAVSYRILCGLPCFLVVSCDLPWLHVGNVGAVEVGNVEAVEVGNVEAGNVGTPRFQKPMLFLKKYKLSY